MTGPTVLVTGSTEGIGKATTRELATWGVRVILHGRNQEKGYVVLQELEQETGNRDLDLVTADLSLKRNVIRLAEGVASRCERLDVLINNAGVFERTRNRSPDCLEMTLAVNYLALFLLTLYLLPYLKKSSPSRVVTSPPSLTGISGTSNGTTPREGHTTMTRTRPMPSPNSASSPSSHCLAQKIATAGITVNCLHRGVTDTKLLREGYPGVRGNPPAEGAMTSVFRGTLPRGRGGNRHVF